MHQKQSATSPSSSSESLVGKSLRLLHLLGHENLQLRGTAWWLCSSTSVCLGVFSITVIKVGGAAAVFCFKPWGVSKLRHTGMLFRHVCMQRWDSITKAQEVTAYNTGLQGVCVLVWWIPPIWAAAALLVYVPPTSVAEHDLHYFRHNQIQSQLALHTQTHTPKKHNTKT